jgi:enoyl-CoA hydratase/carnithine racemase
MPAATWKYELMIISERRGADLLLLTVQRPDKRNALSRALIEQLTAELQRSEPDPRIRGVILAGAGPSFCAGVDLHEFAEATPESARLLIDGLRVLCLTVRGLSKPVACAIQGHCLGGALELAACADFRIATPDALLGMPEVVLGLPSVIDAVMLGHLIGVGRARELLLTGEPISGETAFQWGLVNRLSASADLINVAADLLRRATRHRPEVIAAQKRVHQQWLDLPYTEAVDRSVDALVDAFRSGHPQRLAADRLRGR